MDRKDIDTKERIAIYADKYIDFFEKEFGRTRESYYRFFDDVEFANDCRDLGFEMDCGHSFSEACEAMQGLSIEEKINKITDVKILGSGLFSQWRYYNHWSSPSFADNETKEWFIRMLRRLKEIS